MCTRRCTCQARTSARDGRSTTRSRCTPTDCDLDQGRSTRSLAPAATFSGARLRVPLTLVAGSPRTRGNGQPSRRGHLRTDAKKHGSHRRHDRPLAVSRHFVFMDTTEPRSAYRGRATTQAVFNSRHAHPPARGRSEGFVVVVAECEPVLFGVLTGQGMRARCARHST